MAEVQILDQIASLEGKYLTFSLSQETYGVNILKVQEIIGVMHITRVPSSPDYLKGVINLRGKIIPVVDLRLKFGLKPVPYDEKTCIIVVEADIADRRVSVGVVVDTVVEVLHFSQKDLEPSPEYGINLDTHFIQGMGRIHNNEVVILININEVLVDTPAAKFFKQQESHIASH